MKDFAAIDFETANGRRTSVCSVGVVVVRGGEVVDTLYSLIRPRPTFLQPFHHGHPRPQLRGYGPGARFRRRVEADCAPYRGAAARGAQLALRRGVPARRVRVVRDALSRLPVLLYVPCLAQDVRQQPAQPPAPYRVGGVRFRPCQPPPCPGRCRGVRADRAENPVTGFLSRNRNSRQ